MNSLKYFVFCLVVSFTVNAQVIEKDTTKMGYDLKEIDTLSNEPIQLEEILVYKEKLDPEAKKQYLLLRNRVYKTYPYAKIASERLTILKRIWINSKQKKRKESISKS